MSPVGMPTAYQSGLALMRHAFAQCSDAAKAIAVEGAAALPDAGVAMMMARQSAQAAEAVTRTADEMDQAILDILA